MMALQAYYDTRYAPITFDYANFLVCAEAYRQSINLPRINLHVVIDIMLVRASVKFENVTDGRIDGWSDGWDGRASCSTASVGFLSNKLSAGNAGKTRRPR